MTTAEPKPVGGASQFDPGEKPTVGRYLAFDHISFWVGNAKQAASFYVTRFGFTPIAYRGLENGDRNVVTHVVRQGKITFALSSPLQPDGEESTKMGEFVRKHGDAVRDIAFEVEDLQGIYDRAVNAGATSISPPREISDEFGVIKVATLAAYGETVHTLVDRSQYKGSFMPGFEPYENFFQPDPLLVPTSPGLDFVDHCVANHDDGQMEKWVQFYMDKFAFHRFWSVDENQVCTEYSALRSTVMTDWHEIIKVPINEPAVGKKKSQIKEFVEYYGGSGVQHIALNTTNILQAITVLRSRGVQFLDIPKAYYDNLRLRLASSKCQVEEDLTELQKHHILVDFDDYGYLLQIFTKPVEDRPTLFYEIIQRHNHQGFGAGNFKALFESLELEQARRGNLY